jgi:predicted ATP-grasp superfamily ATP-dependent carboligase
MSELIVPEPLVHGIVDALFNWSKSADLAVGVLIDAFAKQGMKSTMNGQEPVVEYEDSDDISVLGVGSTVKMRELIGSLGIKPLEQGVIKGITGVLLGEGRRRGLDIMSIMVEADPTIPDARAAATLISHLNELLPAIDLDHAPLLEEAERIEEQVRSMVEGTGETETSSSASSMIYG